MAVEGGLVYCKVELYVKTFGISERRACGLLSVLRSAARARVMRLHGIDRDAYDRYTSDEPAWFYRVVAPGFKYNMTDMAAAIGVHQLRRLRTLYLKREQMARRYSEALRDFCVQLPANPAEGDIHAWHLYVIRLTSDAPADGRSLLAQLARPDLSHLDGITRLSAPLRRVRL